VLEQENEAAKETEEAKSHQKGRTAEVGVIAEHIAGEKNYRL